jgi:putative membrane protein
MAFLTDSDRQRVAEAIRAAENETAGELVTVVARASDGYEYIPLLWATGIALLVPLPLIYIEQWLLSLAEIYAAQLAVFLVLSLLFRIPRLHMALIPRAVKHMRAARLAREQFLAQRLHRTAERSGVLIFVSVAERYVEILADEGINDRVAPDEWDSIVAGFVIDVKRGRIGDGFVSAVAACGALLSRHFPKPPGNPNELPDRLVEL